MAEPPESFESLQSRLDNLEKRVSALEKAGVSDTSLSTSTKAPALRAAPAATTAGAVSVFSLFGRAMLGIAGAYLLRAIADSGSVPRQLIAALALAYALGWLIAAARGSAWLARTVYTCTSALILIPMLWELTLRFHVLAPAATAAALGAFVAVPLGFSVRRSIMPVAWISNGTAAALALALAVAAHSMLPFALLLLAMLAAVEFSALRSSEHAVRGLIAVAADLAVWIEIYIYSAATSLRAAYPPLSTPALLLPGVALCLLSCGFVLGRTVLRRRPVSTFDIVQAPAAFLLGICALMLFAPGAGAILVRLLCLVLAVGLYGLAYTLFSSSQQARNCSVFSTWSAALLLAGLWMSLDARWLSACLGIAALVATLAGARLHRLALQFHGAIYLTAAALAAGLPGYIAHALSGPAPAQPGLLTGFAAVCAVLCYLFVRPQTVATRKAQVLPLYLATAATAAIAALVVERSLRVLALGVTPQPHHLAFVRTLILCLLALGLTYAGARRQRSELTRIGYAIVALVALKLLVEDLRIGHLEYIAASICLFALTLIAAPRVVRNTPPRMRSKLP